MKHIKIKNLSTVNYSGKIYDLEVKPQHTYQICSLGVSNCSSGLHGVGMTCVSFLSDFFEVQVKRDGGIFTQKFEKGIPVTEVERIGDTTETGTWIKYHPDPEIFKLTLEPSDKIQARIKELASLNPGVKIHFDNQLSKIKETYYYKDGIIGYVDKMIGDKKRLFDKILSSSGMYTGEEDDSNVLVDFAFIYDDEVEPTSKLKSFANNINTYEGGYHLQGFKEALKKEINKFIETKKLFKNPVEMKYLLDGLYGVVSVKVPNAEFEGQTKTKLGNAIAQPAVEHIVEQAFNEWKRKEPDILEAIATRAIKVKEAEEAARAARSLKRQSKKATRTILPSKLSDCSNNDGYRELFIVEGLSASGSAKDGRYRSFQAVLPLRGKILNTLKAPAKKVLESEVIQTLVGSMGAGFGDTFNHDDCRYDKIVIFTDADSDGYHIKSLLLTFFYKFMPGLIENGYVYSAIPPLYRIIKSDNSSVYLFDDVALRDYRKKHQNEKYTLNRFKG